MNKFLRNILIFIISSFGVSGDVNISATKIVSDTETEMRIENVSNGAISVEKTIRREQKTNVTIEINGAFHGVVRNRTQ